MNHFRKCAVLFVATCLPAMGAFAGPNTVQFDPTGYTVNEDAGTVTLNVTATRLGNSNEPISVDYTTRNGSAMAGEDYVATTGTVSFGPGETFKQIQIQITNDTLLENAENFFVDLTNPQPPATTVLNSDPAKRTATVTIADDDSGSSTFQFSSANYSVNEGDGFTQVTVVRSGGTQLVASVNYATSNGSAQAGQDYTAASGTLTFNSGETSKTIFVPITDDAFVEGNENFLVTLSSPSFGAALGTPNTATVTIVDNDGGSTVQFNPTDYTVNEAAGQVVLTVTANRLGNPSTSISVNYATRSGSAVAGQDYTTASGTVTFGSGETQKQIAVQITNDTQLENAENFFVDLSNPQGASLKTDGSSTATVNIADDDSGTSTIQFSAASYSVSEGGGSVALTVVRSGGVQLAASANYATADGTAHANSDYTAASGSVSFAPGETQKTIIVGVNEDSFAEGDENFTVTLSAPSPGAALGNPSTAVVTIVDNDGGSTIQFNPKDYTVNEAAGQVVLTVTANRLGDTNTPISANYATRNGSAVAGQDYTAASGTVTFGSGETQKQIVVQITNDTLLENAESFFVDLSNPQGASLKTDGSSTATVNIADDDSGTSTIQFSSASYSVNEGGGSVALTVVRSGGIQLAASANYATADGTAHANSDYTAASGSVSFAPGETQKTIIVGINEDSFAEGDENFTVMLSAPSAGAALGNPSTATVTIVDDDGGSTVQFNPKDYTVNEAAGQVVLTVIANRLGDANALISVNYATRNGSAIAGQDYGQQSGTVVFGSGETQKQIVVQITNDTQLENAENFFVDLSNPQNASLKSDGSSTATVNIADDDSGTSTIQFSAASYSVNEGGGSVALTVVRSGGVQLAASANYATADGTAHANADYTAASGSVSFAPGETQKTIIVGVNEDSFAEGDENFTVTLSAPSAGAALGTPSTATVTIVDNDGGSTVQFDPTNYTVNEAAGQVVLTVTANRLGDANAFISVSYATRNGSAIAGQDYGQQSGTIVFGSGETQKQIAVQITNDTLLENAENFFVDLSNPQNASLKSDGSNTGTVTIADDDSGTSTIQFSSATYAVNENAGSVTLTVVRSGGVQLAASVNYTTVNGTASAGSDYIANSGSLNFAPGETQKTIVVQINDDAFIEGDESFSVNLSNPSAGATLGNPSSASVTIIDNDGGGNTVRFNPTTYSVKEMPGNSTITLSVIATRLGDPNTTIFANYTTSNGSATAGQDYTAASGTLVFSPGETQQFITVTILDDALIENAENFFVTLTNATNASITGSPATVTIADDDSPNATIGFSKSSYDVDEGAGSVTLTVTRSGGLGFVATVHYATSDQSAMAGKNYVASSGNLTFAPGETSKDINISIIDEGEADPTLQFTVTLSDLNGTSFVGGQSTATVNILDNDANTFRFAQANYITFEGAGSVTLTVNVVRSGDPAEEISVDYVTIDGSARAGEKYTRTEGRLTFGANVTSRTITVPIIDEPFIEGTTNFSVVLSNPLPATSKSGNAASRLGSPSTATVSIFDNDARTFQFSASNYTVANSSGAANVTVAFSRAGDSSGTFTVDFATMDDSAVAGRDYTATSGTLTFAAGETSKAITIQIASQPAGQPTRQFEVVLSNPSSGAELGQNSVATVTITNPDFSTKLFNISTRGPVQTGNDVMIAGFIVQGDSQKRLVLRGIGPSLTQFGVPSAIADPTLALVDSNGTQLAFNDDYTSNAAQDQQTLANNGLTPSNSKEAAIVAGIAPGSYTAILRGKSNGVGLIEVYDISNDLSTKLVNISTRGKVEMGDNGAMIAGFIVSAPQNQPGTSQRIAIRAIGPTLKNYGVNDALADTTLDIYRGSQLILSNDNWKSNSLADQQALQSNGLAPASDKESAIITNLDPGSYSAVVRGKGNTTGVGLVEVYNLTQ